MKNIIEVVKSMKKSIKPKQNVNGKSLYIGGSATGNSGHCQGGGGW
ncbi:hypothetical protein ACS25B_01095 [Dickeya dadantii subsp. dieffenbachiae]|nr:MULTISPECIES: hypothetical protein [Dickeya]MCO7261047.1 hypothetical protein [Dickeya zeae]